MGFEARLRHYNNMRNTPLNPQYRDIDLRTKYHPVTLGLLVLLLAPTKTANNHFLAPKWAYLLAYRHATVPA